MPQGILPFKYEAENICSGMTALGGLPAYLDLAHVAGLRRSVEKHLGVRRGSQGWTDAQMVTALVMLNLAGGEHVDDLRILECDEGFCRIVRQVEHHHLEREQRRQIERRFRRQKERTLPSPSAVFRYLAAFHDPGQEKLRTRAKAFIPAPNAHLSGMPRGNGDLLSFLQANRKQRTATLDMDATVVETRKASALYSYKGFAAYQPLNTWWAEQEVLLHTEFRDGNVPAGYEQLRVLKEALACLPEGVEEVYLRSDTAGYQHELLRYCEQGGNGRFGRIGFAIGADVTAEFRKAVAEVADKDWRPLYKESDGQRIETGTEWAEVCFVPDGMGHSKNSPVYRYLAKRTLLREQGALPGMESPRKELPFQTVSLGEKRYKVFGVVTNLDRDGEKLIHWHHERCGKSEEAHAIMKNDLAGGKMPSDDFGENAAWWWMMVLALNLGSIMKSLALGKEWQPVRLKALRFRLLNLPGRVVEHARRLLIKLSGHHPGFALLLAMRQRILSLSPAPT